MPIPAFDHLDLLEREDVPRLRARVAYAVDEHAGAGVEAANLEIVASGLPALAGVERDAGDGPERLDE
jgi:hypothetical protein